jgi:hypothetical protein
MNNDDRDISKEDNNRANIAMSIVIGITIILLLYCVKWL